MAGDGLISVLLTSVDHIGVVEIVQADEDLIQRARDEQFLEDVVGLHLLQCPQAHAQRGHDENLVVAMLACERE